MLLRVRHEFVTCVLFALIHCSLPQQVPCSYHQPDVAGKVLALYSPRVVESPESYLANSALAYRGQFPWHVAIKIDKILIGSGALISPNWVLTAASLVRSECTDFSKLRVILGDHISDGDASGNGVSLSGCISHSSAQLGSPTSDVALLELSKPITLSEYINVIRLPSRQLISATFVDQILQVSGWGGYNQSDDSYTERKLLSFVGVRVLRNSQCLNLVEKPYLTSKELCVSGDMETGPCLGDNGDPAVIRENDGQFTLVGIVSLASRSPCQTGDPSTLVKVTSFLDWIEGTTGICIANV